MKLVIPLKEVEVLIVQHVQLFLNQPCGKPLPQYEYNELKEENRLIGFEVEINCQ